MTANVYQRAKPSPEIEDNLKNAKGQRKKFLMSIHLDLFLLTITVLCCCSSKPEPCFSPPSS